MNNRPIVSTQQDFHAHPKASRYVFALSTCIHHHLISLHSSFLLLPPSFHLMRCSSQGGNEGNLPSFSNLLFPPPPLSPSLLFFHSPPLLHQALFSFHSSPFIPPSPFCFVSGQIPPGETSADYQAPL